MIEDTSKTTSREDAARILLLAQVGHGTGEIEAMESRGQRQLVESTDLPTKSSGDEEFIALGFTFGAPHPHDPLFRPATLPAGWKKQAKEHAMGSAVVDEHGRERVSIFYKAAFYDRRADMHLVRVFGYLRHLEYYDEQPVLDDTWATVETVTAAARDLIEGERESLKTWTRPDVIARDPKSCAHYTAQHEKSIGWYEALIARIGG
jgi:hypothetical protein